MPRRAARKDKNHRTIAAALTDAGCTVVDLSQLGGGVPDLLVGATDNNTGVYTWLLCEIKSPGGTLTPMEAAFLQSLPDDAPSIVARSLDDILDWFGRL